MLSERALIYYLQGTIRSYNYLKVALLKYSSCSRLCKAMHKAVLVLLKAMLRLCLRQCQAVQSSSSL